MLGLLVVPDAAYGQSFIDTADEFTGARDRRLILRSADARPPRLRDAVDEYLGAAIVLACGDRLPSDSGRTMLLFAGEPLGAFGAAEEAYVEVVIGSDRLKLDLPIWDRAPTPPIHGGRSSNWYYAFFRGASAYFNRGLLERMASVDSVTLNISTVAGKRRAVFPTSHLRVLADSLPGCAWK